MVSDKTQARHAAQLGFLQQYLDGRGYTSTLVERGPDVPLNVLTAAMPPDRQGRARAVNFAYIPTSDKELAFINLLQFYSPLPFAAAPNARSGLDTLLGAINVGLPIGHFGLKGDEIFLRHVHAASASSLVPEDEFIETVGLFISMEEAFGDLIEEMANGKIPLAQALAKVNADSGVPRTADSEKSGSALLPAVKAFLRANNWSFSPVQDTALVAEYAGSSETFDCFIQAREEDQQLIVYSVCPFKTRQERLLAVAEFIARANYGMFLGNFELDMNDGEVRFKTSLGVKGETLSQALLAQVIFPNVATMDRYLAGIRAVAEDDVEPKDAIEAVEG